MAVSLNAAPENSELCCVKSQATTGRTFGSFDLFHSCTSCKSTATCCVAWHKMACTLNESDTVAALKWEFETSQVLRDFLPYSPRGLHSIRISKELQTSQLPHSHQVLLILLPKRLALKFQPLLLQQLPWQPLLRTQLDCQ